MSSKSSAQPEVHTRSIFTRKIILLAVIAVAAMFFIVITYYPLIFSSEKALVN